MKSRRRVVTLTGIVAAVLLVPALIWSGKRATDAATRDADVKLPEISTVGPEMTPYVLTPAEREKLKLPAFSSPIPLKDLYEVRPESATGNHGPYPGMTPAELEKLAAWRARVQAGTVDRVPNTVLPRREAISTFDIVPRAPGIEGMTPLERAKAEAYSKEGGAK